MSPATPKLFVFRCSGNTYMKCIEKGVFGSNAPWPLQVKAGDALLLHRYEYYTLPTAMAGERSSGSLV